VNNEDSHQANDGEADNHVKEFNDWTPDKLEDDEPENAFTNGADKPSFLCHISFGPASIAGKDNKHSSGCSCSLKNCFSFIEQNNERDQISMRNSVNTQQNIVQWCSLKLLVVTSHSKTDSNYNNKGNIVQPNITHKPFLQLHRIVHVSTPSSCKQEHKHDQRVSFDNETLSILVSFNSWNVVKNGSLFILLFLLFDGGCDVIWNLIWINLVVGLLLADIWLFINELTLSSVLTIHLLLAIHLIVGLRILLHLNVLWLHHF